MDATYLTITRRLLGVSWALALLTGCFAQPAPARPATPSAQPTASSTVALTPAGAQLVVANRAAGSAAVVDAETLTVRAEIPVGGVPRTVALTPDGALALVTSAQTGTLSLLDLRTAQLVAQVPLGAEPYGVVADAARAYVSLTAGARVAVVDLATRTLVQTLPVESFPAGLALSGDYLYVTHLYTGRITRLYLPEPTQSQVMATEAEANLAQNLAWQPDGRRAYLPLTLMHTDAVPLRPEAAVSAIVKVLDLAEFTASAGEWIALAAPDRAVNLPVAAVVSPDGRWLYVANAGTDDVAVVDLSTQQTALVIAVGHNPRGLALSPEGSRLYVHNALDSSLSVVDVAYQESPGATMPRLSHVGTVALAAAPLSETLRLGQQLFNSALPPMSQGWLSCATCHFEGGHDARTWLGFPDGPRNTPTLFNLAQTAPYHWNGDLDELQDTELTVRAIQGGAGLIAGDVYPQAGAPNAGRSVELDALAAYLQALTPPPAPAEVDAATAERGARVLARWGCTNCHPAPRFTDQQTHTLARDGIGDAALQRSAGGLNFDTPALGGVWASAPFFHDGSAATLRDTLYRSGFHGMGWAMNASEVDDLLAYLQSLP